MKQLGWGSGVKIYEDGNRLLVLDTGASSLAVVVFVCGLLTLVAGGMGVVLLFSHPKLGGGFLAAAGCTGALLGLTIWGFIRRWRRPPEQLRRVALIDLEARTLRDPEGRALAPLDRVRFERTFQVLSSTPALAAIYPGGKLILARGNVFAGMLGTLEPALRGKGLMG